MKSHNTRLDQRHLKQEYKRLFERITHILGDHDPIGIMEGNPYRDEYSPETGTILPRALRAKSVEEVREIVHTEFIRWFGDTTGGPEERYSDVAQDIWEAIKERGR